MTDLTLTLALNDETLRRLTTAAEAAGMSVQTYAALLIEQALTGSGVREDPAVFRTTHDWTEADRRLAEYDRTGEYVAFEDWADDFRADVQARLSKQP